MIDPKAKLADQVAGLGRDGARLCAEVQERCTSNIADSVLEFVADAETIIERQQKRIEELQASTARRMHVERAYLRVIQEFIAAKRLPSLTAFHDAVGMLQAQTEQMNGDIERLATYLRGLDRRAMDPKLKDLVEHLDFYIFHELMRKIHYIEHFVLRDARLALVSLTEADFGRMGLGERPEPPVSQDMPS